MANHKAMTVWCNKYERVCFVSTVINNTQDCLDGCVCRLKAKPPTHPQNDSLCNQTPCGSTVMHHENMHENVSKKTIRAKYNDKTTCTLYRNIQCTCEGFVGYIEITITA